MPCLIELKVPAGHPSYFEFKGKRGQAENKLKRAGFVLQPVVTPGILQWRSPGGWSAMILPLGDTSDLTERLKSANK